MLSIVDVAKDLADAHRKEDPDTQDVYLAGNDDEVRLVEVSDSIGTSGEILPFRFPARSGIPFPSVLIVVSREEWELLRQGRLKLPDGWGDAQSLKKIA